MRDMFERNEPGSSFYLPPTWQTDENGFGHHKSSEIETQIAYQPFIAGLNREHALLCAVTVGFIVSTLGAGILLGNHINRYQALVDSRAEGVDAAIEQVQAAGGDSIDAQLYLPVFSRLD